jgi:hypothetical protein
MPFIVTIKWTGPGVAARQLLITNLGVQNPSAFVEAVNDFIRGYAAVKFSRVRPRWDDRSGSGRISWSAAGGERYANITIGFQPSDWVERQSMKMTIDGFGGAAAQPAGEATAADIADSTSAGSVP